MTKSNLAASVRQRLLNKSKENREAFDFVLSRYAIERFLYRLSLSQHSNTFVLKGAILFYFWNHEMHRPTRDIDFLGSGTADCEILERIITEIVTTPACEDGLTFNTSTIKAAPIREEAFYDGIRAKLIAKLGTVRIPMQIDIGFGDAVTPAPETKHIQSLITELPGPEVNAYPMYSVIAEKLEAMVVLGEQNSRMKDFFDIHFLLTKEELNANSIREAVVATFKRRRTDLPLTTPPSLLVEFAVLKQMQWKAFLRRNNLESTNEDFSKILEEIREHLPINWISLGKES
ncbi:conserved domain protein [Verrucomicrobiia bacterium DG1235]|nr:conserved domain protein [Verrucomicrobiae bacterium DG1235]